jgi:lipopolysaccharide export system protein LptA
MIKPFSAVFALSVLPLMGLFLASFSHAQESETPVILNHADSLVGSEINGEQVKELIGHVKFTQGKVVVTCRKAVQFIASKKISLEGDVEVLDSTMRMVGERGMYYSTERTAEAFDRVMVEDGQTELKAGYGKYFVKEKRAYFTTHVYVEDSSSVLTSDELTYFREEQHSIATGHVRIQNPANRMTIFGERFENFKKQKLSRMTISPRLLQIDTSGGKRDTLAVTSVIMESTEDSIEQLHAIDSVHIRRSGLEAAAGSALFYTKLDSIILRRSPFIWYRSDSGDVNQLFGDSVFLRMKKRKLDKIYVRGNAHAIAEADSSWPGRYHQMTGQQIIMNFSDNKPVEIDVKKTAISLYYLFDGKTPNGVNRTSGDEVIISFRNGKIDRLKVVSGVEGQYYPERQVRGRESEYNLPGFLWRPPKSLSAVRGISDPSGT